jgi:predicted metal-binding protein
MADDRSMTGASLHVCVTCRADGEGTGPLDVRAGRRLFEALAAELGGDAAIDLVPVECLSVCKRPCTVSFAAPGKWTYIYGDLPADAAAPVIAAALRLYRQAPDGLIPWKARPAALKTGVVARVPPLRVPPSAPARSIPMPVPVCAEG